MINQRICFAIFVLTCTIPTLAATRSNPTPQRKAAHQAVASSTRRSAHTSTHSKRVAGTHKSVASSSQKAHLRTAAAARKPRGQQGIDSARTAEIQQALIREHYLDGEATGVWDQATRDALIRFQNDNHWQNRIVPDSRALIKLGLGPSQQNLLNPESAAIAVPSQFGERNNPNGSN
jgi:hypothetical protein